MVAINVEIAIKPTIMDAVKDAIKAIISHNKVCKKVKKMLPNPYEFIPYKFAFLSS